VQILPGCSCRVIYKCFDVLTDNDDIDDDDDDDDDEYFEYLNCILRM